MQQGVAAGYRDSGAGKNAGTSESQEEDGEEAEGEASQAQETWRQQRKARERKAERKEVTQGAAGHPEEMSEARQDVRTQRRNTARPDA